MLGVEVAGHYAFGFVAALFLADLGIAALVGAMAVLIDSDHLLSALSLPVSGRPDHSILYVLVSTVLIAYLGTRIRLAPELTLKLLFIGPIVILSHLAYDKFASSNGTTFQLAIPFSYSEYFFANGTWIYFEFGAIFVSVMGYLVSKRLSGKAGANRKRVQQPVNQTQSRNDLNTA